MHAFVALDLVFFRYQAKRLDGKNVSEMTILCRVGELQTFRTQDLSFPRTKSPETFRCRERSFPGNESSRNFRSWNLSFTCSCSACHANTTAVVKFVIKGKIYPPLAD